MNIKITPGMTHGGKQFTPQQWGEAGLDIALGRTETGRLARAMIVGAYAIPAGISAYRATAGVRMVLSWVRHPVANYFARYRGWTWLGTGAKYYLHASKANRYANYVAFAYSPFATYHYLKAEEYEKAIIQYFGPIGAVWVYEKYSSKESKDTGSIGRPTRELLGKELPRKKPAKMPQGQRMRLWRMGLRWCRKHRRYDRCSLRAR